MANPFLEEFRRVMGADERAKRAAQKAERIGPSPWDESQRLEASVPRRPDRAIVAKALEGTPTFADLIRSGEITAEQAAKAQALKKAMQEAAMQPEHIVRDVPKTYPIDPATGELVFTAEQMAAGRALKRAVQEARDWAPMQFERMSDLMKLAGEKAERLIKGTR